MKCGYLCKKWCDVWRGRHFTVFLARLGKLYGALRAMFTFARQFKLKVKLIRQLATGTLVPHFIRIYDERVKLCAAALQWLLVVLGISCFVISIFSLRYRPGEAKWSISNNSGEVRIIAPSCLGLPSGACATMTCITYTNLVT